MSYVKLWLHCVWTTKNRKPFLNAKLKSKLIKHIFENAKSKNIYIAALNGASDHLHWLLLLQGDNSLSKLIQLIKGESSFWVNKENLTSTKFSWQDDFYAISVSPSIFPRVKRYINNQDIRHKKQCFETELTEILNSFEWQ